jgi:hypothetical protein
MKDAMQPFQNQAVAEVFGTYPAPARRKLMALRQLIFDTAAKTAGVGMLEETLKWGEPAYLTAQSKGGSTVRIAWKAARPNHCAMYFNCQTTLVETFKTMFSKDFEFEGNRAIVFDANGRVPTREVAWCIAAALTYHRKPARKESALA